MISSQRVLFSNDGTLTDYSYELDDFRSDSVTIPYTTAEDFLYIGTELPFNNKYIDISTANSETAEVTVQIWFGNEWVDAVDIIDRTKSSGASLGQDGHIIFNTNDQKGWDYEADSADVDGLTGTAIYNMFWTRLKWDASLTSSTAINYIGQKFSEDGHLYDYYPDLNNSLLKTSFEDGKTTWDEQHFLSAQNIVRDLKRRGIVVAREQLFDFQLWQDASIHKVASIIYAGLGKSYFENMNAAIKAYKQAMEVRFPKTDKNASGRIESHEKFFTVGELSR